MTKTKTMITLVVLLLVGSAAVGGTTFAQPAGQASIDADGRAEKLLALFEKARLHIESVFQRLEDRGVAIPETARARLADALEMAEEAVRDYANHLPDQASEKAVKALERLGSALQATPEHTPGESNAERYVGLSQAVQSHLRFLDRLEALVDAARSRGVNTTGLELRIAWARSNLTQASELIAGGNESAAAKKLGDAKRAVNELVGQVHNLAKAEKPHAVEAALERLSERLSDLQERAKNVTLPPQAHAEIADGLSKAKERADEARSHLGQGRVDDAVASLRDAAEGLRRDSARIEESDRD